jgi:hypothetical protein
MLFILFNNFFVAQATVRLYEQKKKKTKNKLNSVDP